MIIVWRDINLKSHEIDLSNAVDVKINGFKITEVDEGITVHNNDAILIKPISSNWIKITK